MENYRVISVNRGIYTVKKGDSEKVTRVLGKYRHDVVLTSEFPVVGDYVTLNEDGIINGITERRNCLSRKKSGTKYEEQAVAANVDILFITMSMNRVFDMKKMNRLFILAGTNHIRPVVVLTKADLCENTKDYVDRLKREPDSVEYIISGKDTEEGTGKIKELLLPGITAVFVGPSGVGKSTLVNALMNREILRTGEIRLSDDKGRHTTTDRQLFYLENGAAVIDSPGIREIGLWINETEFEGETSMEQIARRCKFRDCTHQSEPGCAVLEALRNETISESRYKEFVKLTREIRFAQAAQVNAVKGAYLKNQRVKERERSKHRH